MNESANRLYRILVWVFLAVVVGQLFLAGLASMAQPPTWSWHKILGHASGLLLIALLFVAYLGSAGREVKLFTWALFLVWAIQVYVLAMLLRESMPIVAAIHPVLALADFWLALRLLGASKSAAS